MNEFLVIDDIESVLVRKRELPTVVMWNRLEGRPRTTDFSRALRAEVRDPLWMLSRQWQVGEFQGEDAGSPVTAKVRYSSNRVTHVQASGGAVTEFDERTPLEATIEALPVPLTQGPLPFALDQRLALGRHWVKLLSAAGLAGLLGDFLAAYGFTTPDPDAEPEFPVTAHAAVWQGFAALAGRAVDGAALYLHLRDPAHRASDGLGLAGADKNTVDDLGEQFMDWAGGIYHQPASLADSAWSARQLEYQMALSAPQGQTPRTLIADEYHGGDLDWFAFDVAAAPGADFPAPEPGQEATVVRSFIPTGIQFDGMPNTRWWAFEEGRTNFGDVRPDTTDLSKLLLIEFGLIYANDWFLAPIELPMGTVTEVEGLAVTNVFGERFWIEPTSRQDESWSRWSMFELSSRAAEGRDPSVLLLGTTPGSLESKPVEAVYLIRDEVSNMVWGVETVVQLPDGSSRRGREAALELQARYQAAVDAALAAAPPAAGDAPTDAAVRYELMSSVAENWIPFVPMHVENDPRETQLQRGAMARLLAGADDPTPDKIRPRTVLLREGLDEEVPRGYYVAEEEVSRAGEYVTRQWQRARGSDGRVFTWLGAQRRPGRGEGSSGLAFDLMRPTGP